MNKKIAVLIAALFISLFVAVPLASIISSLKIKMNGVKTEATVLSATFNKRKKNATVSFSTPDGTEITAVAAKYKHVVAGDKVTIWYDPEDPQKIDFGDTIRYNMKGVLIGGLIFIFLVYFFIKFSIADRANKKLISSGMKIAAEFVAVDRDERFRAGDNNPWIIRCRWVDNNNNREYFFVSKTYTIDPAPYLNGRYHIDVYINPADPGKYYMDTSFMPEGNNTIG